MVISHSIHSRSSLTGLLPSREWWILSPRARCLHYLSVVSGRPMTTRRGAVSLLLAQILPALRTEQLIAVTSLPALVTARFIVNPTHNHPVFTLIAGYNGPSIQYYPVSLCILFSFILCYCSCSSFILSNRHSSKTNSTVCFCFIGIVFSIRLAILNTYKSLTTESLTFWLY